MLLGIDIGGTTINFGLVENSEVVGKKCVPSFSKGSSLPQTLDYLVSRIDEIITPDVKSIGIGVPTIVDPVNGVVYDAANIPSWTEVRLKSFLESRYGIPVQVNNDANCFALGAYAKVRNSCRVLVGVTLGTGTGVGIVTEGKIFSGAFCGAGEISTLPYLDATYEDYCSSKFFINKGLGCKETADAAFSGDIRAVSVFKEFGAHMGALLSVVMYAYDPGCIVLGGGVSNSFSLFRDSMMDSLRKSFCYARPLNNLEITAMPQEEIALLGASLL